MTYFQFRSLRNSLSYLLLLAMISCHPERFIDLNLNPKYSPTVGTLYESTRGYFEWVSTKTPNGIITPKMVGYTKQMVQDVDPNPKGQTDINYLAFYKDNSFQRRYNETLAQTYVPDFENNTLVVKYDTVGYLKWYINFANDSIQISEFINPYDSKVDTIRSTYKRSPDLRGLLQLPIR